MKYIVYAAMLIVLCGCKKTYDYLNVPDRETIDARIWESDGAIQYLLNEGYFISMPEFPWHNTAASSDIAIASDESVYSLTKEWPQKTLGIHKDPFLADNFKYIGIKYQGDNIGDNRYYEISRCNLAIQELPKSKTLDPDKRRGFLGQFHLIRAMVYFQLAKYYGGVPIITEPLTPETIVGVPRAKAKDVFSLIIADCDAAVNYLDGAKYNGTTGKLTKAAAVAWKARVLLYFASPLFNPVNDPEHPNDPSRWNEAYKACKEAYDVCKTAGHELVADYDKIFQLENANNKEAIIIRSYSAVVTKRGNNVEAKSRPPSEGGSPDDCFRPTVNMLNAYGMKDGVPADKSQAGTGLYKYDSNHIWLNRDPRFDATIGYNGGAWALSGKATRRQWTYEGEANDGKVPFYCKRFVIPTLPKDNVKYGETGGSGMDWIELRFAEVMLNYAEAANEVGQLDVAKNMVREIRKRAKIEQGSLDYGLALVSGKEEMRELILQERMVEFAFESKRQDDLRRMRRFHLLSGKQLVYPKILKLVGGKVWKGPLVTDSATVKDWLMLPLAKNPTLVNRDTINVTNPATMDRYFVKYDGTGGTDRPNVNIPADRYFYGLNNFYLLSAAVLEQTKGWPGGTFDPL